MLGYGLFFVVLFFSVENFFLMVNVIGLLLLVVQIGMVVCIMMFCLVLWDFDFSVGFIIVFVGVFGVMVLECIGSVGLVIGGGLLVGVLIGVGNGVLIVYLCVNVLIVMLVMMLMVWGLVFIVLQGQVVGIVDEGFISFGDMIWLGLLLLIWLMVICFFVFGVLFNYIVFGCNILVIGGNFEVVCLVGVCVEWLCVWIFLFQGVVMVMVGLVLVLCIISGQFNVVIGFELDVIFVCVLGGVLLQGGKVCIFGVVIGVFIMGMVENVMNLFNVDVFY